MSGTTPPSPPEPPGPSADELEQRILGSGPRLRRQQVCAAAGVSLDAARRFWRALGFANVTDSAEAFTGADVEALRCVVRLVDDGLVDDATAVNLTRALGRSADRLASWQVDVLSEVLTAGTSGAGVDDPRRVGARLAEIAERTEPLLVYAWRRHLASAVAGMVVNAAASYDADQIRTVGSADQIRTVGFADQIRTVGFADLVAFSRVVRRSTARELAGLVDRFEAVTSDIVSAHAGRVVKTVGDEVMFVAMSAPAAGVIALDIAEAMTADALLPDARVALATGPVVARLGDVFGTTVNRASRLTGLAPPGAVLVDELTAVRLVSVSGLEILPQARRELRGVGRVTPSLLRRSTRLAAG